MKPWMLPGPHHRGLTTTTRTLFACFLKWELKSEHGVIPTPTRFKTNSLYTPFDNTPLHSIPSVCRPWCYSVVVFSSLVVDCDNDI